MGSAFANGLLVSEGEDLQQRIAVVDDLLSSEFPQAASAFLQELPQAITFEIERLAAAGQFEPALAQMDEAQLIWPDILLTEVGSGFAQGWSDWDPATLAENVTAFYEQLAGIDFNAASQFQAAFLSRSVSEAQQLAEREGEEEMLALVSAISSLRSNLVGKRG